MRIDNYFTKHIFQPECVPPMQSQHIRSVKEQISPYYDSRHRTNYAQKTSLTNSSIKKTLQRFLKLVLAVLADFRGIQQYGEWAVI